MRIIAKRTLRGFWEIHPDAEIPLRTWYSILKKEKWNTMHDVKKSFGNASIIGDRRVVFNIKGNSYRLVVYVIFLWKKVFIRFIGTHQQYDKINASTI